MRRALLLLPVLLVLGLTPPALASHPEQPCPTDVTGTNPTPTELADLLEAAARTHDVPPQVLKSIAWAEGYDAASDTHWRQYGADGRVIISSEGRCGIGILQITEGYGHDPVSPRFDRRRLAEDVAYNIDTGARILAEKWASYAAGVPAGWAPDRSLIENWYHPARLYNGTAAPQSYPDGVALRVRVPHAHMPGQFYAAQAPGMPWTLPTEAFASYGYPALFVARPDGTWVSYDANGVTAAGVGAVHPWSDRPNRLDYGSLTYGPEDTKAGFSVAGPTAGWRSADGVGLKGRAMWTRTQSATNASVNVAAWEPLLPCPFVPSQVAVEVFIPTEHADAQAVYRLGPRDAPVASVVVDQSAHRGQWVPLGRMPACGSSRVSVGDSSPGATADLAVDAVRYSFANSEAVRVTATTTTPRVTAGNAPRITGRALDANGMGAGGATLQLLEKPYGSSTYVNGPTVAADSGGSYSFTVRPTRQTSYVVRTTRGPAQSAPVLISVFSRLSIETPAPGSVVDPVTFRGELQPAAQGAAVGLAVILDGRFTYLAAVRTDAGSRYTVTRALPRGTHTFVVYTSARNGTDKGSKSVSLTVR